MSPMSPRLLRPRQTGLDPRSIAGLELWLDFSDSSTVTLSGSSISQVNDKSGKNYAAVQATGANQPTLVANAINGKSVASFDGSNDQLTISSFPAITALTAFGVAYRDWTSRTAYRTLVALNIASTSGLGMFVHASGTVFDWQADDLLFYGNGFSTGRAPRAIGPIGALAANQAVVLSGVLSSSASDSWVNGTRVSTRVNTTGNVNVASGTLRIGAESASADYSDYKIAEILMYTATLTSTQIKSVERYLGSKYGITIA